MGLLASSNLPSSKVDFFIYSCGKSRLFDLILVQDEEVSIVFFPVGSNAAFPICQN